MADDFQFSEQSLPQNMLLDKLSDWETKNDPKAPLSMRQKDLFMEIMSTTTSRILPQQFCGEDGLLSPRHRTDSGSDPDNRLAQFIHPNPEQRHKIDNAQQFFSWFTGVEEDIEQEGELPYKSYIQELSDYGAQCDEILTDVGDALDHLHTLQHQYLFVSNKTNALHEACEHLLAKQANLINTAESLNEKLSYFNDLDLISSKLGSPAFSVTSESFPLTLSRLDECILHLNTNKAYKESELYLAKFKQSLTKALNLIKQHVVTVLQNATEQVLSKKGSAASVDSNAFTMFYGRFRTNAPRVKSLMEQIEQRVNGSPEYQDLLTDCHHCYFTQRESLLAPSVSHAINDLSSKHQRDHCSLMRSGCAFLVHVCQDEYQLFYNFFSRPTPLLHAMLERLCGYLYDVLRPLIIHTDHLETLSELCSILKVEMLEEHVFNNSEQLPAFESISTQMLMDVQERLVYRTHIYIRSDILRYSPAGGDLAYPDKLEMMQSIAESVRVNQHSRTPSDSSNTSLEISHINHPSPTPALTPIAGSPFVTVDLGTTNMPMSPADLHGMWYPTVRRTLVCLSKLYRCIDKTTFQGLSQEALSMCIQSLKVAKAGITKRSSDLDGDLFLIKHLLILREQIAPFRADFSIRETSLDFTSFKDAAIELIRKKSKVFALNTHNSILQLLLEGTPNVSEHFVDSKKEVDMNLKDTCEHFISSVTKNTLAPLTNLLDRVEVIINMQKEDVGQRITLSEQPFAKAEKVSDVVAETYKNIKTKLVLYHKSMALYLANSDTQTILFKPIRVNIHNSFQSLHSLLLQHYSEEDQQIIACPSLEQINLQMSSGAG